MSSSQTSSTTRTARQWVIAPNADGEFYAALSNLHPLVAQVLYARGYQSPEQVGTFLQDQSADGDPARLMDIDRAAERIGRAIQASEPIAVYGDYDCDGVTACALLHTALGRLGANVHEYFPDRFDEGYGLNSAALTKLKGEGYSLVITADCGIRAAREAAHARDIGLDLIITDHHEPEAGMLPDACAVINPRRPDCAYPFKSLAGVGVAYRLAQALLKSPLALLGRGAGGEGAASVDDLLDLVAVGTIADVVPLTGENRWLVREGLKRINASPRPGLKALIEAASARRGSITAETVGFTLAPRLNAAGRIDTARDAYDLLIASETAWASELADRLNKRNAQRQLMTAHTATQAEDKALGSDRTALPALLFAALDDSADDRDKRISGVVGLAAARLVDRYYRPAVVVAMSNGEGRGSCRSIDGFHMTAALDECHDLLLRYGGHAAAAGFTARVDCLDQLHARLNAIAQRSQPERGWTRAIRADAEVHLEKLNFDVYGALQQLEPHGMGNPRPVFVARGVTVQGARRVGRVEGDQAPHLQLRLRDGRNATWDAIAWRMGERKADAAEGAKVDVAFHLDVNEWNGETRLQLVILDFRLPS